MPCCWLKNMFWTFKNGSLFHKKQIKFLDLLNGDTSLSSWGMDTLSWIRSFLHEYCTMKGCIFCLLYMNIYILQTFLSLSLSLYMDIYNFALHILEDGVNITIGFLLHQCIFDWSQSLWQLKGISAKNAFWILLSTLRIGWVLLKSLFFPF